MESEEEMPRGGRLACCAETRMHFASLRGPPWTPSSSWTPSTPSRLSGQMFEWSYGYFDDRSGSEKLTAVVLADLTTKSLDEPFSPSETLLCAPAHSLPPLLASSRVPPRYCQCGQTTR